MKTVEPVISYEEKKRALAEKMRQAAAAGKLSLGKDTSNLFRPRNRTDKKSKIDVRPFNNVLRVDPENLVADVEGMTTYETLVRETLKYSCLPAVVPELKSITVGGALAGCGIESSSFRYGLVHETVEAAEILLADGTLVSCTRSNAHSDLLYAFPNTFGTLGYALKITLRLIPAKKYVQLTHLRFSDKIAYFSELNRICVQSRQGNGVDYVDGVVFGPEEMYLTLGTFTDTADKVSDYRYHNIYYRSIQQRQSDTLTTLDYIWRWDPDWFWCSDVFFMQNPVMRTLFGKFLLSSVTYGKIMHFVHRHPCFNSLFRLFSDKRESVIQDVAVPIERAPQFFDFLFREIGITPIWICPAKGYSEAARFDFCPLDPRKLYVDFGFWGGVKSSKERGHYNRKVEAAAASMEAFKSLYSSSYYTEEEFWELYNFEQYSKLKAKYDPEGRLRDLYQKCCSR